MEVVRIDPAGYRRTPWKNGGGVTIDIADSYRPGAAPGSWTGMIWRLGRTWIDEPGPFSDLTGYDRILTVVTGRGLRLRDEEGGVIDVREPLRPVRFAGELTLRSDLEDGPVEVLNLIGERGAVAIGLDILAAPSRLDLPAGEVVLHAVTADAECLLAGERVAVPPGGAARVRLSEGAPCEGRRGILAVATIGDRSPGDRS